MKDKSLWDEVFLLPAQLSRAPLFGVAEANPAACVGKNALIPLSIQLPVVAAHMSYGSVPDEFKVALARAASKAGIANGSGDGGVLLEEMELSASYIYEYTPELYGLTPDVLDRCGAVEIKIGQGAKGALGENLPENLPVDVYHMRGTEPTAFFSSQGRFGEINSAQDLKILIDGLREGSGGKPVGVKLAAGRIEEDLDVVIEAGADFVDIDGQNAGCWQKIDALEGSCLPALYALSRAKKHIEKRDAQLDIIVGGGFYDGKTVAKAVAMGASAVVMGSALIKAAKLDENRALTLSAEETEEKLDEFFKKLKMDLMQICAFTGRSNITEMDKTDIATSDEDIAKYCDIEHI